MTATLLSLFARQVSRSPKRTALRYRSGGFFRDRSWREWQQASDELASALCALGIQPGDRIGILSHTRIRWVEADLGVLHAGAAMVPIYPTLRADAVGEILRDSGARALFAEDPVQLGKVLDVAAGALPELRHVILFERVSRLERPDEEGRLDVSIEDVAAGAGITVHTFDDAVALGRARREARPEELAERAAGVSPETLAAIYYTSGTSGEPKGVRLTHDNFVFETQQLSEVMPVGVSDEQLLFLPLAHIVAKLTVMLQLRVGFVTSFAASIDEAASDAQDVRPTFLVGVPRVYEKIQEAIEEGSTARGDIQQRVFDWALDIGRRVSLLTREGHEPGALLTFQRESAERLVFSKIKQHLGGRVRFLLSGAAPLSQTTAEFFHALGLLILEGYGLTESTGASTLNTLSAFRFGTVGRPLPGLEVKLAEDGEILLRGRSITPGYHGRAAETREAFTEDGCFRTGDVGSFDRDGFLTITDRKKDLIITAGGKNIAPQRLEMMLRASPFIEHAVVLGDRRKFAVALIVLEGNAVQAFCREHGFAEDLSAITRHPRLRDLIAGEIERVNAGLARFEAIKRFEILNANLTVEGGDLTPTGKVRRGVLAERFADIVDALYEGVTTELEDIS